MFWPNLHESEVWFGSMSLKTFLSSSSTCSTTTSPGYLNCKVEKLIYGFQNVTGTICFLFRNASINCKLRKALTGRFPKMHFVLTKQNESLRKIARFCLNFGIKVTQNNFSLGFFQFVRPFCALV